MSVRGWHCSVCRNTYNTRRAWLSHLLELNHQSAARKDVCRWDQVEKDCTLIVFATFPIGRNDEVLHFFSKGSSTIVTNFVWFESRPTMGLVQFESRLVVDL